MCFILGFMTLKSSTAAPADISFLCSRPTFGLALQQLGAGRRLFRGAHFLQRAGLGAGSWDRGPRGVRFRRILALFLFSVRKLSSSRVGLRFGCQLDQRGALIRWLVAVGLLMLPSRVRLAQSKISRNRNFGSINRTRFGTKVGVWLRRAGFLHAFIGVHAAVTLFLYVLWEYVVWRLIGGLYSAGSAWISPIIYLRAVGVNIHAHILVVDLSSFAESRQESTGLHSVSPHFWASRHVHAAAGVKAVRPARTD